MADRTACWVVRVEGKWICVELTQAQGRYWVGTGPDG